MKTPLVFILGVFLASPVLAQDWSEDNNQGIIEVVGGTAASGTIIINCADTGNSVVPIGSLALYVSPASGRSGTAGDLTFVIGDTSITLPFADNGGDSFVHDKNPDSVTKLTALVDALETGDTVVITQGDEELARIGLEGAGVALAGVEPCLLP